MNTMNISEFKWIDCVLLNDEHSKAFKFTYILSNTDVVHKREESSLSCFWKSQFSHNIHKQLSADYRIDVTN